MIKPEKKKENCNCQGEVCVKIRTFKIFESGTHTCTIESAHEDPGRACVFIGFLGTFGQGQY